MSRNGKGTDIKVVINLDGLRRNTKTFKDLYINIETKKGITTKSIVCFDMMELIETPADVNGDVSISYCNASYVKILTGLLNKLEIIYHTTILKQTQRL